eukprot:TRINITY_DN15504_c0_g1_i1.p1 TRINITY_DN15504_c0_g1~~TRINITY_DN15504_c0_g1_i1.p1  ORF type:complete len:229 (+),score=40.47 TRINITY_DN15504_c0_g1_i1:161-847(+)
MTALMMHAAHSGLAPTNPAEAAESRSMQLKQKMNQQRQLLLQRQRGNAQHLLQNMAQANTHAPIPQAPIYRSMGEQHSGWPSRSLSQADTKDSDQHPEGEDSTAATSEAGGEAGEIANNDCDNLSEATCELLDNIGQAVATPPSVKQPRSFLQGEDPRGSSRDGKSSMPSLNRGDLSQEVSAVELIQDFDGGRPASGDRREAPPTPQLLMTSMTDFGVGGIPGCTPED